MVVAVADQAGTLAQFQQVEMVAVEMVELMVQIQLRAQLIKAQAVAVRKILLMAQLAALEQSFLNILTQEQLLLVVV
jgi:hypothetical protein